MPTQDERFATLESFRTETIKAYGEMAYELTIVKGLGEDSIKRLAALHREMNERFESVDTRLGNIETAIQALAGHIMNLHTDIGMIKAIVTQEKE